MSACRIASLHALVFRAEDESGLALSFGRMQWRQTLVLLVEDDAGRRGYGECWVNWPLWAPEERLVLLREGIAPLVVGCPEDEWATLPGELQSRLARQYRQAGCEGPLWHAISALEQALRDLTGRPVPHVPVQVYGSGIGPSGVIPDAQRALRYGLRTVKLRVGFGMDTDLGNLAALRRVLDEDVVLAVDANQHFTLAEAVDFVDRIEPFGVGWIEEPTAGDSVADLVRLFETTGLTIATGENVYGIDDFQERAAAPGVGILQPDVTKVGGVARALDVIAAVEQEDVAIVPHMYGGPVGLAATLALAAVSSRVAMVEYDLRNSALATLPVPIDGLLRPFTDHAAALALMDSDRCVTHDLVPQLHTVVGTPA